MAAVTAATEATAMLVAKAGAAIGKAALVPTAAMAIPIVATIVMATMSGIEGEIAVVIKTRGTITEQLIRRMKTAAMMSQMRR